MFISHKTSYYSIKCVCVCVCITLIVYFHIHSFPFRSSFHPFFFLSVELSFTPSACVITLFISSQLCFPFILLSINQFTICHLFYFTSYVSFIFISICQCQDIQYIFNFTRLCSQLTGRECALDKLNVRTGYLEKFNLAVYSWMRVHGVVSLFHMSYIAVAPSRLLGPRKNFLKYYITVL